VNLKMLREILLDKIKKYLINNTNLLKKLALNENLKVSFLAQGEYNINFTISDDIRKYVFRVNTGSQLDLDNQIVYEYNALKALEISGVTPVVYHVDDKKEYFDYGILIMEYLDGRPLEYDKDLNKAAGIFGSIHSLDLNNMDAKGFIVEERIFTERIKEGKRLLSEFMISPKISLELKRFFDKFLNYTEKNAYKEKYFIDNKYHAINNTEVNSHNFIIGKKSFLIDWEKPVITDPCQDLTQFLAPTTTLWKANYILNKDEVKEFYRSYNDTLNKDIQIEERVQLYNPYLLLRALSWCGYAYLEYQNPNKEIKNMDTFEKIKEYLDINFMEKLLRDYFV